MNHYWQGELVRLRAVEPDDWEAFHAWNQDAESARRSWFIPFPRSAEGTRRWTDQEAMQGAIGDRFRWVIETLDGEMAGTINSHSTEPREGTFGYGLAVRSDYQRRGLASEAVTLVLRYFFRELRYQKCTVHVFSFNEPSIRLHERLGFQLEGRIRRMIYTDGRFFDDLVFGLTAEEFDAKHPFPPAVP